MDSYLKPPQILCPPPSRYADSLRQFQGIPGIEQGSDDRLWATWYGGGVSEDNGNYILLTTSADNGRTWSEVKLTIDSGDDVRAYDPCIWRDPKGRLWLFWAQGYEGHTDDSAGVWCIETNNPQDESPQWSEPRRLCDGIMMNKPTVLSTGEWLLSSATWYQPGSCGVYASSDNGASWQKRGAATIPSKADRSADEHMIVERQDGSLWMLIRTQYGIGESISTDGGCNWSEVAPSAIKHLVSRFFIRRLNSGNLILVKHGSIDERIEVERMEGRSHLTAYLSSDDGKSWSDALLLDERVGISYPDGFQSSDHTITITYDFDRRGDMEILMTRFTEEDIRQGSYTSKESTQRKIINKASGQNELNKARAHFVKY
jgi:hypothetical protein